MYFLKLYNNFRAGREIPGYIEASLLGDTEISEKNVAICWLPFTCIDKLMPWRTHAWKLFLHNTLKLPFFIDYSHY